jgi:general secretion pathway protein N
MAGRKLIRFACGLALVASLVPLREAVAQGDTFAQAALDTNTLPTGIGPGLPDPVPGALAPKPPDPPREVAKPPSAARGGREPRGNPLWAIPLKSLSATRERPILLPSRRAPQPAIAGPPPPPPPPPPAPPPPPPERPHLALVGVVAGDDEGIAIFVDQTTRDILRLRTGENHAGWTLRSVKPREVTLQKDRETMSLALPAPTDTGANAGMPGLLGGMPPGYPGMRPGMPGMPPGMPPPPPGVPGPREPVL